MPVSSENKKVAKYALDAMGGSPRVQTYHRDAGELSVDILSCPDRPCAGVTSYSTIGLSDHAMIDNDKDEFPVRIELAGACATASDLFPNILAAAALCIMGSTNVFRPGSILEDYVRLYCPSTTVPHLFLTGPYLWEDALTTLNCGSKNVCWLLVVPFSEAELQYLNNRGLEALEDLFENRQVDIFDLNRDSVI